MEYPQSKPVCQLDADGLYTGQTTADLSPMEAAQGIYLLPAGCIDAAPPESRDGHAARWTGADWEYLPDYRGQTVYDTATGQSRIIDAVGALPEGVTTQAPPDDVHDWDGSQWVLNPAKAAVQLAALRDAETERINAAVYAVQQPLLRFQAEYELRETQARAYAEGGYSGEVPSQVAAYATPVGLTPQQATDIILQQADMLHAILEHLATLRMRKFELQALDSVETVSARTAEILAAVAEVAAQLHGDGGDT